MSDENLTPRQKMENLLADMMASEQECTKEVLAYFDSTEWQKVMTRFERWQSRVRPAGPLDNAIISFGNAVNAMKLNFQAQAGKTN